MKKLLILTLCLALILCSCSSAPREHENAKKAEQTFNKSNKSTEKILAMWISQYDISLMCLKDGKQRPIDEYLSRVSLMIARLSALGINTIFVQARPNGDSLYDSDIFPPSSYASGNMGKESLYDVFGIIVNEAVRARISVHAWINPLRLMKVSELSKIDQKYTLGKWKKNFLGTRIVTVGDFCYLDPAFPECRALIVDGAVEIMKKYQIDGIHIDDYFYPTTDQDFDLTSYARFGENIPLGNFRRNNITLLISELYAAVNARGLLFGVSPCGNSSRNYNELYADVDEWCKGGIIDYLCPQIYFGIEHETFPFERTAREFYDMCRKNNIEMIIGMTLEKAQNGSNGISDAYAGSGRNEWIENRDVLARCVEIAFSLNCDGLAFFSYRLFYSPDSPYENEETREEREALYKILSAT